MEEFCHLSLIYLCREPQEFLLLHVNYKGARRDLDMETMYKQGREVQSTSRCMCALLSFLFLLSLQMTWPLYILHFVLVGQDKDKARFKGCSYQAEGHWQQQQQWWWHYAPLPDGRLTFNQPQCKKELLAGGALRVVEWELWRDEMASVS